jgi:hypothetical protein
MENNQRYVNGQLKLIGAKRLTKKQIKELKSIKNDSEIEKKLLEFVSIRSAEFVHYGDIGGCGLKAVIRIGSDTSDEDIHFCFYCDKDFQLGRDDYRYSVARPAL